VTHSLVSVILTTMDRPRFLRIALRCYRHQSYPNRELIVVDDGANHPADPDAVRDAGGTLIRLESGTPLGDKLNAGVEQASGAYCQKMDDDDWYGPRFLERMVETLRASQSESCQPAIAFVTPFLFFEIAPWEVRRSLQNNIPGATLLFDREDWRDRPFRSVRRDEDVWFFFDHLRLGRQPIPVAIEEQYLAVRHRGTTGDRGHTWTHQTGEQTLEDYICDRPLNTLQPESILPGWAIDAYWDIRASLGTSQHQPGNSHDSLLDRQ
jgi:glycosyltransferase involved in cell wall biosynthesis